MESGSCIQLSGLLKETLNLLKEEKHPGKIFIARVEQGFGFLGYFLKPKKLEVALSTLKRFKQRISQLYVQSADYVRIEAHVRHWLKWVRSGIGGLANLKTKEYIKKT